MTRWIFWALMGLGTFFFARHTWTFGDDFRVYYEAARHLLSQTSLYSFPRDGMMCFKYPPYYGLIFLPLGWFEFSTAKMIWIALQIPLVPLIFYFLSRYLNVWERIAAFILFWSCFVSNAYFGQVAVGMVFAVMWIWESGFLQTRPILARTFLLGVLSVKIFQIVGAAGLPQLWRKSRDWLIPLAILAVASIPFLWIGETGMPLVSGLRHFLEAGSSTPEFTAEFRNFGLPAAFWRVLHQNPTQPIQSVAVFIFFAAVLGWRWFKIRAALSPAAQFYAALSLGVVVHPLAWKHAFLFALPMYAAFLQDAKETRDRKSQIVIWVCAAVTGAVTSTSLGSTIGGSLDFISEKSLAIVFAIEWMAWRKTAAILDRRMV